MNFQLYNRPYSSHSLRKNLNIATGSTSNLALTQTLDLHMSKTERILFTQGPVNNLTEEDNLPESSQYKVQVYFPERPTKCNISGLTLKENDRTQVKNAKVTKAGHSLLSNTQSHFQFRLPTDQDFTRIITKLEMVSSNRTAGQRRIMLNDGENVDIILEAGETQFISINSKGKKPPLVVVIKKSKGKVISYVSKTHSEPTKGMCDGCFKIDSFQVSDVSVKFKIDVVYLGIEAISETFLNVSVRFGTKMTLKTARSLKITQEEQDIINSPVREFNIRPRVKKVLEKDFVKINIEKQKNRLQYDEARLLWNNLRRNALIKKKEIMMERKNRYIEIAERKDSKRRRSSEERVKRIVKGIQGKWLAFMMLASSSSKLNSLLMEHKNQTKLGLDFLKL